MSHKAREWAANLSDISRLAKTILKEIADRYNDDSGMCWPSQQRLARDTGYSRSSVNRALNELESKGYIFRQHVVDSDSGGHMSNRYSLPAFAPHAVPGKKVAFVSRSALSQAKHGRAHSGPSYVGDWTDVISIRSLD